MIDFKKYIFAKKFGEKTNAFLLKLLLVFATKLENNHGF
jgi:hypothetical protein